MAKAFPFSSEIKKPSLSSKFFQSLQLGVKELCYCFCLYCRTHSFNLLIAQNSTRIAQAKLKYSKSMRSSQPRQYFEVFISPLLSQNRLHSALAVLQAHQRGHSTPLNLSWIIVCRTCWPKCTSTTVKKCKNCKKCLTFIWATKHEENIKYLMY